MPVIQYNCPMAYITKRLMTVDMMSWSSRLTKKVIIQDRVKWQSKTYGAWIGIPLFAKWAFGRLGYGLDLFEIHVKYQRNIHVHWIFAIWLLHNQRGTYFGQSEDWIFCVSLVTLTGNVWCKTFSHICRCIGRHLKRLSMR